MCSSIYSPWHVPRASLMTERVCPCTSSGRTPNIQIPNIVFCRNAAPPLNWWGKKQEQVNVRAYILVHSIMISTAMELAKVLRPWANLEIESKRRSKKSRCASWHSRKCKLPTSDHKMFLVTTVEKSSLDLSPKRLLLIYNVTFCWTSQFQAESLTFWMLTFIILSLAGLPLSQRPARLH